MMIQCCNEFFPALVGCAYNVSLTCIQNSDFASPHIRMASERSTQKTNERSDQTV